MVFGKKIISYLRRQQIGENIRDLGLDGQKEKEGTPTMGGLIIIFSTLIPVLLLARLDNIYIILLLITYPPSLFGPILIRFSFLIKIGFNFLESMIIILLIHNEYKNITIFS